MPNWVTNQVRFRGDAEKIRKLRQSLQTEVSAFDFNKIIPMPEELSVPASSDQQPAIAAYQASLRGEKSCPEITEISLERMTWDEWVALGKNYVTNIEKYNAPTWYEWCWDNWGTKWNACDVYWYDDDDVEFNTAWACPEGIYEKLAEMYPDIHIDVSFADEDIGNNCGIVTCEDGNCDIEYINTVAFACEVLGYDEDEIEE